MRLRSLALLSAVAFFLVSPGFACGPGSDDPEFHYGAAEMRGVIEGDWAVTMTPAGGEPMAYTVHLQQATKAPASAGRRTRGGLIRAAYACGARTLVASASACIDTTTMPLDVTLAPGGSSVNGTPTGSFQIMGTTFGRGYLGLTFGDWTLSAEIDPDGTIFFVTGTAGSGAKASATLRRL
jgi:hypothetical protein